MYSPKTPAKVRSNLKFTSTIRRRNMILRKLPRSNVQRFLTNFFRGVFWLCCVAFCCVLLSFLLVLRRLVLCVLLCCVVLWCDVMCCAVLWCLLFVSLVLFLSFPVPSLHDTTQQLDGHTTVRPARPTRRLNKQNFHCVFSTGKHRFFRAGFVITTTFFMCLQLPWLS